MHLETQQAERERPHGSSRSPAPSRRTIPALQLPKLAGNRATTQFVQTRLESGATMDVAENEARRVEDRVVQSGAVPNPTGAPASSALLVEDSVLDAAPEQMRRSMFLERLRTEVCRTAEEALFGTIFAADGCPWIDKWFAYYAVRDAQQIERAIRKYAPEASEATSAAALMPIITARLRKGIQTWTTKGEISDAPETIPPGPRAEPPTPQILFKGEDGDPGHARAAASQPQRVLGQLGAGQPLAGGVRSQMESAFKQNFSAVRVHTDSRAGGLSSQFHARAFTIGSNVAFASGQYQPGTLAGDALIAHELAHVVQQGDGVAGPQYKGGAAESDLEDDADSAAVSATLGMWGGIARHALPRLKSGLRLQRCSFAKAPTDLDTAAEKAAWIEKAIDDDAFGTSKEIVQVFKSAASKGEFLEIQHHLNMASVMDYLKDWDAVQVGAIGPVLGGVDALNESRVDFIVKATHDFSLPNAQPFVHFIFSTMHTDDMRSVLTRLSQQKKMGDTILQMPEVIGIIEKRGLKLVDFRDRGETAGDFFRGMKGRAADFMNSSYAASGAKSMSYYGKKEGLPEPYQKLLSAIEKEQFDAAFNARSAIVGTFDYLTFGIPHGVYSLVTETGKGMYHLTQGEYEKAGAELTGATVVLITHTAIKGYSGLRGTGAGPGDLVGPKGSGQFVIKGFTGPIPKDVARMGSILALAPDAQAVGGLLLKELGGEANVLKAAWIVQADSQAAILAAEGGIPALQALLQVDGNVLKARMILGTKFLPTPKGYFQVVESAEAKVTPKNAAEIADRVAKGEPGLDPSFKGKVGGATFFVSKGEPYTGTVAEQSVTVQVSVKVPRNAVVFDDAALVNIQVQELTRLFEAQGAKLPANFADSLRTYIQTSPRKAADFPHKAADLNVSNRQFRNLLGPQSLGAAERAMWDRVGASVVQSGAGVGRVVLGEGSPYSKKPGEFLVVRDVAEASVVGGDAAYQAALEAAKKKGGGEGGGTPPNPAP